MALPIFEPKFYFWSLLDRLSLLLPLLPRFLDDHATRWSTAGWLSRHRPTVHLPPPSTESSASEYIPFRIYVGGWISTGQLESKPKREFLKYFSRKKNFLLVILRILRIGWKENAKEITDSQHQTEIEKRRPAYYTCAFTIA